jgi:peptidoglycan/LPS O-acetylase OafA/YrhL
VPSKPSRARIVETDLANAVFDARRNNLEFIRLSLAILVILSHSFPLGTGSEKTEPILSFTHGQTTGGGIAVDLFFALSGFLIAKSFLNSKSVWSYLRKRVCRIYPGFIIAMLAGALLFAPLGGATSPFRTIFGRVAEFVFSSLRLREFAYQHAFMTNPAPGAINGSSWTIQYEFWCYIGVACLGLVGVLGKRTFLQVIFLLSIGISFLFVITGWKPGGSFLNPIFGYPPSWARLLPMYLAGVVFYLYRERIPHHGYVAMAGLGVLALAAFFPCCWRICFPVAGTYVMFWLGYHPRIRLNGFGRYGDFSYGAYLYAFPIQQLIMRYLQHTVNPMLLFAIALPLTLTAAFLSWHLVEKWFISRSLGVRGVGSSFEECDRSSAVSEPFQVSAYGN